MADRRGLPQHDPIRVDGGYCGAEVHRDLPTLEGDGGPFAIEGAAVGKNRRPHLDQMQSRGTIEQVRQFAGQFHAGRTGADDHQSGIL